MTQHQRSPGRFLPTYATLVGLPALALLVILRVGNAVVPKDGTLTTPVALPVSGPASPTLAGSRVTFTGFALFMGAAMSVTAFPVLARILTERRLTRTPIGALAIACAAIDDVTAWCILAAVVVIVRATGSGVAATGLPLWVTLGGSAAYVAVMLTGGRRALRILETRYAARGRVTQDMIAVLMLATRAPHHGAVCHPHDHADLSRWALAPAALRARWRLTTRDAP